MEQFGLTVSNLIKDQFPQHYREQGPLLVAFVTEYYRWLESRTLSRDNWFVEKTSLIGVQNRSANVVGRGTWFLTQYANGDNIAIAKDSITSDYEIFTIKTIANNTFLTLTMDKVPDFTHANTRYATVSSKPNALFVTRNFPELHDVDETFDEYIIYFKEKYLKNLQFKTITNTRKLIKHSLDLYRSKGTERSMDLLYKIVFGKPAKLYYPGQDIFRLSSGEWFIPQYLELSPAWNNKLLINKEIKGVISGATAFVEEIVRRCVGSKVIKVAYISAINGNFITGEKVTLFDNSLDLSLCPTVIGSLNDIEVETTGAGAGFVNNEIVHINSINGRGGLGKVTGTTEIAGLLDFTFVDGGYGYSNTEQLTIIDGTVSVASACTIIIGTATDFIADFSVGDYISVWSNATNYETGHVAVISSNTNMQVATPFSFTNTAANASFTRYFAQTFISEKILEISNLVYTTAYTNYEYTPFLGEITQPAAYLNYVSATGNFANLDHIYTYFPNTAQKGHSIVLSVSKKTLNSGILTVSILSGDMNDNTIWTTANAIAANLAVANGYVDITAAASVIGHYANVTVTLNNFSGAYTNNEVVTQPATAARGVVLDSFMQNSNTEIVMRIKNTQGIFRNGFNITGANTGSTAQVMETKIFTGVIDVSNVFYSLAGNYVRTNDWHGTVRDVSLGTGAQVVFSNNLLYSEEVFLSSEKIFPYVGITLGLPTTYGFPNFPTANLSSSIGSVLESNSIILGKVQGIISTNPGSDYDTIPIIRLHEPTTYAFNKPDQLVLVVTDASGFTPNETITQTAVNAHGLIMEEGIDELVVQNLKFHPNAMFITTSSPATQIVGETSGFTSNVLSVDVRATSSRVGSDVTVNTTLIAATGAMTSVKIVDSGFAFNSGEMLTMVDATGTKQANGFAVQRTHGVGSGYYRSNDGFLSDDKKLSDGWYYQEYSYEVQSSVIDSFKRVLKDIVHVAGTKYFDALIYDTINTIEPTVETSLFVNAITGIRLRDDQSFFKLRGNTDILITGQS